MGPPEALFVKLLWPLVPVCLCIILSFYEQDYWKKWWADFIETWCYVWAYQSEELIDFWWSSGPRYGFRINFPFFSPLRNREFFGDLLAFLIQSPADFSFKTIFRMNFHKHPLYRVLQKSSPRTFWSIFTSVNSCVKFCNVHIYPPIFVDLS